MSCTTGDGRRSRGPAAANPSAGPPPRCTPWGCSAGTPPLAQALHLSTRRVPSTRARLQIARQAWPRSLPAAPPPLQADGHPRPAGDVTPGSDPPRMTLVHSPLSIFVRRRRPIAVVTRMHPSRRHGVFRNTEHASLPPRHAARGPALWAGAARICRGGVVGVK